MKKSPCLESNLGTVFVHKMHLSYWRCVEFPYDITFMKSARFETLAQHVVANCKNVPINFTYINAKKIKNKKLLIRARKFGFLLQFGCHLDFRLGLKLLGLLLN